MEIIKFTTKLTAEERETHLNFDNINKKWIMDSTITKHYNKAIKQGWKPIRQYVYEDGSVCGMLLEAPSRAITIRSVEKKTMSDKQLNNLNSSDDDDDE